MVTSKQEIESQIRSVLDQQQLAVLSTQRNGQPYSSLMAFAFTSDLHNFFVATGKATRKHQNIIEDARVSLLVDNRSNRAEDFHEAVALTILGRAEEIEVGDNKNDSARYLMRHPYLDKFLHSPSTSFFKISVSHYILVSQFQNVLEYTIGEGDDLFT